MLSPTWEWLRLVQEQHGCRVKTRPVLCFSFFLSPLSLALYLVLSTHSKCSEAFQQSRQGVCISSSQSWFTLGWSLIYCLSDWLTHWLLADHSVCCSLVNNTANMRQRQEGGWQLKNLHKASCWSWGPAEGGLVRRAAPHRKTVRRLLLPTHIHAVS